MRLPMPKQSKLRPASRPTGPRQAGTGTTMSAEYPESEAPPRRPAMAEVQRAAPGGIAKWKGAPGERCRRPARPAGRGTRGRASPRGPSREPNPACGAAGRTPSNRYKNDGPQSAGQYALTHVSLRPGTCADAVAPRCAPSLRSRSRSDVTVLPLACVLLSTTEPRRVASPLSSRRRPMPAKPRRPRRRGTPAHRGRAQRSTSCRFRVLRVELGPF